LNLKFVEKFNKFKKSKKYTKVISK